MSLEPPQTAPAGLCVYETKTETRYIPPRDDITKTYDKDTVLIEAEPEVLVTPHHRAK